MHLDKKLINLKDISFARNFIYGISILWIVFYHCALNIPGGFFQTIKAYGDCAVEIFFLLSGCFLYFSYTKNHNVTCFYKKRLKRILPYYLIFYGIVFASFNLIINFNPLQFFLNYTMLDFWINGLGNSPWFLAGIIIFYLSYPLIYKIFFEDCKHKKISVSLFLIVLSISGTLLSIYIPHLRIFIYRIPIFLIGCLIGKFIYEEKEMKFYHLLILIGFLLVGKILFSYFANISIFRNIYYIPLSLIIVFLSSQLYKFNEKYIKIINTPFEYIGMFTLEIYLTHEKVQENLFRILEFFKINVSFNNQIYQCICIALAILISIGLASLIKFVSELLRKKSSAASI